MTSQAPKKDETDEAWHVDFADDSVKPWSERTGGEKVQAALGTTLKIAGVLLMLYLFICSLSFLATGFRLVAGKQAGKVMDEHGVYEKVREDICWAVTGKSPSGSRRIDINKGDDANPD